MDETLESDAFVVFNRVLSLSPKEKTIDEKIPGKTDLETHFTFCVRLTGLFFRATPFFSRNYAKKFSCFLQLLQTQL